MIQSARVLVKERMAATTENVRSDLRSLPSVGESSTMPEVIAAAAGIAEDVPHCRRTRAVDDERARLLRDGGAADAIGNRRGHMSAICAA